MQTETIQKRPLQRVAKQFGTALEQHPVIFLIALAFAVTLVIEMASRQSGTAIIENTPFILPAPMDDSFTADELSEDMEGLRLTFPKVKIPGGGVTQFEMASDNPERPDYIPDLEGILLYNHSANAYWEEGEEYDDNTPPLCQSLDGKIGHGTPGGLCASCGYNAFGSAAKGKGKACSATRS